MDNLYDRTAMDVQICVASHTRRWRLAHTVHLHPAREPPSLNVTTGGQTRRLGRAIDIDTFHR